MGDILINILRFLVFLSLVITTIELFQKSRNKKQKISENMNDENN